MRVLWFAINPSMYDEKKVGGWIASLERIMRQYHPEISLGIAFEHEDTCFRKESGNVTYYPMHKKISGKDKFRVKFDYAYDWQLLKKNVMAVVEDFKPDIIQCFGSEWPFAAIASEVSVPVVVHMQGFMNAITVACQLSYSDYDRFRYSGFHPMQIYRNWRMNCRKAYVDGAERQILKSVKYFMGRTHWDKRVVEHYGSNAQYYHCEEAIRQEIYDTPHRWQFAQQPKMSLITVSQATEVKGNEMILRTARILKEDFHFDFVWKVAGNKDCFRQFEKKTGILASDVNVELLGFIDAQTIARELSQAQLYIHPAIIDNSPNSLCEAQLVGCPVVSANVGGISQLVEDGKTGILYPYNEPHTLAFRIMELHNNRMLLEALSGEESRVARKRHAPETIAADMTDIYSKIITHYRENHKKNVAE